MRASGILCAAWLLFIPSATPQCSSAADRPLTEIEKIESLIQHFENLKEATFIRNGSDYNAKTAAKFLRGKWEKDKQIKTALEFIEKIATASSTSGKPYKIRFKNSRELNCAEYLKLELDKLERGKPR